MKTNLLLFLFVIFSLGSFAQHDFSLKPVPKIDFNSGMLQADSTNFTFESKADQPNLQQYFAQKKQTSTNWNKWAYSSNMPIAKLGNYSWNMPIAVPDSTINYAIRELRIYSPDDFYKKQKE